MKVSAQVMIVPVPVAITLKPRVDHGRIRFTVLRAEVFGAYVLADFVQMFVNRLTLNLDALTEAVTVVGVEVSDAGIAAAFTANDVVVGGGASGWRMVRSPGWADSDTADGPDRRTGLNPWPGESGPLQVLLLQFALDQFAGGSAGQIVQEVDRPGHFVGGDPLTGEGQQFGGEFSRGT